VRISGSDALTLEVHASLLARLDAAPGAAVDAQDAEDENDDAAAAAPLALAIDLGEPTQATDSVATPAL
jgi:exoribonuclease-2